MVKMMPSIEHENRSPWVLVRLSLNKVLVPGGLSYHKLSKNRLISLSVLKLDGSSFCIEVSKNVTVAGIKLALEEVFGLLRQDDQCEISWSDIWGHFCLSYEGRKLVNDKANIQKLGIKDGDQVNKIVPRSSMYEFLDGSNAGKDRETTRAFVLRLNQDKSFNYHDYETRR